ncbi:MAG: hypothetical protein M3454_10475 [Actinomycetota bacterium]|nr:hypothetical protein [Actinomycetota bacterium]
MTKWMKLLAPLTALLFVLAACGQPSARPGGSGSSGDEDVVSSNPDDDSSNKEPGGGAKLVTPQGDAQNVVPGAWRRVKKVDEDTLKVFFWAGVEPCSVLDSVDVSYFGDQVALTLFQGAAPDSANKVCPELAVLKVVEVDLTEPLGGREVVDGADKLER